MQRNADSRLFHRVFIAAPLAFITGLLQAPAIAAKFGVGWGRINRQVARCVHFGVLTYFLFFILIHTTMVYITGLLVLRRAEGGAQARADHPALLHPGLVGRRQVGRRADA